MWITTVTSKCLSCVSMWRVEMTLYIVHLQLDRYHFDEHMASLWEEKNCCHIQCDESSNSSNFILFHAKASECNFSMQAHLDGIAQTMQKSNRHRDSDWFLIFDLHFFVAIHTEDLVSFIFTPISAKQLGSTSTHIPWVSHSAMLKRAHLEIFFVCTCTLLQV